MILHAPFLFFLALCLIWNLVCARAGRFERWLVLPLQLILTGVLLRDRWVADSSPWVLERGVGALFVALFALALVQNVAVWRERGAPRLTEIALVAFNLVVGLCVLTVSLTAAGVETGTLGASLLADYAVLQDLLGHRLAHEWTVCWHLPFLIRRRAPQTLVGAFMGMFPAALAAFAVILLAALWSASGQVIESFEDEPRLAGAIELPVGIWERADRPSAARPFGDLRAWVLPADHNGQNLPEVAGQNLVLALRAPSTWPAGASDAEARAAVFREAAARLSAQLRPRLVLPFPEPDAEATLHFGPEVRIEDWVRWLQQTRREVREMAPETLVGLRLAGLERSSRRLFEELALSGDAVDVLGPRLSVAGPGQLAAGFAKTALETWGEWRAGVAQPPELWVLAAGLSPLAYGERAQERFLIGTLERAQRDQGVRAVLIDGWRDGDRTRGLLRADGSERAAARSLREQLSSQALGDDR